ncbi:MAG: glycosyltransferase family protein [Rikenellaceae bacterium]
MRYIFIVQGEGRGHLTQALALSQMLRRAGHTVEEVLVGRCHGRVVPQFFIDKISAPVTLFDSPTIDYGRKGKRGSIFATVTNAISPLKLPLWRNSIDLIAEKIENSGADVMISFYEFMLGIVNFMHPIKKPIVCLGHQFMIEHPDFRLSRVRESSSMMLKLNNMVCSHGVTKKLALSFYELPSSKSRRIEVVPPLLRSELFDLQPHEGDYLLGYMLNPAYLDEVVKWKRANPESIVHLFWDKQEAGEEDQREHMDGLWLHRLNDEKFLNYMAGCRGYVTTAGFESVCEALYLGKPTLMIPAHLEQQINASDAMKVGAGMKADRFNLSILEESIKSYSADTARFREWVESAEQRYLHALSNGL